MAGEPLIAGARHETTTSATTVAIRMTSSLADLPNRGSPAGDQSQKPSKANRKRPTPLVGTSSRDQSTERSELRSGLDSNEQSPLLSPASNEDDGFLRGPAADSTDEHQVTKSVWYIILLTISIGGLQIAWSVEMSNGSPYLLSLGISKSVMALVWIAGPLSGTLVQPYVGMLSDNCRIPWGKRKPFMLGGTIATIVSLLFLAWTREIVGGFLGVLGVGPETQFVKYSITITAILWVYILDFAINTGMPNSALLLGPHHKFDVHDADPYVQCKPPSGPSLLTVRLSISKV